MISRNCAYHLHTCVIIFVDSDFSPSRRAYTEYLAAMRIFSHSRHGDWPSLAAPPLSLLRKGHPGALMTYDMLCSKPFTNILTTVVGCEPAIATVHDI
jgi:hypothetical protein